MKTLKEIAQECGVSTATVSNILNGKPKVSEDTKKKVLRVVEEAGYQPNYIAQGLRKNRTKVVGIIAEDLSQISTPPIIESVMQYCEAKGYQTLVRNMRLYARWSDTWYDQEARYHSILDPILREMGLMKVSGIIYIAGHARIIPCFQKQQAVPTVMAYGYTESRTVPSVVMDDEQAGYESGRYLMEHGHRKIGVLAGRSDNLHTQMRLRGFQKALYEEQIPFNPDLVCYAKWTKESGYEAGAELLKHDITAVFSMADEMSGGLYEYIREKNLEPGKDISVASINNQMIAEYFYPKLTAMTLPLAEIGQKTAELAINQIENGAMYAETPQVYRIPCRLQVRDSVCNIKNQEVSDMQ